MIMSLYSNGNIGGEDLRREIESINANFDYARTMILEDGDDTASEPGTDAFADDEDSPMMRGMKKPVEVFSSDTSSPLFKGMKVDG